MFLHGKKIKQAKNALTVAIDIFLQRNFMSRQDFHNLTKRQQVKAVKLMMKIEGVKLKRNQVKDLCLFFRKPVLVIKNKTANTLLEAISFLSKKIKDFAALLSFKPKEVFSSFGYFIFSFRLFMQKILRV